METRKKMETENTQETKTTLVVGGTGKTGRRVVERLRTLGLPARVGSRSGEPPFDWEDHTTWAPALRGEPEAEHAELALREVADAKAGAEWTILRSTWFMQNFSEDYMLEHVLSGEIRLPAGDLPTPFLDADDIADVAVAALTEEGHAGQLYELTGPRSLTFAEAAAEISKATGHEVRYVPVSLEEHAAEAAEHGVPAEVVELLTYLFSEVVDGRNANTTDGVRRALGREPKDFAHYAREVAATGVWDGER